MMSCSFIHSSIKCVLRIYCLSGTILDTETTEENKTKQKFLKMKISVYIVVGRCEMNEQRYSTNDCDKFNGEK